MGCNHKHILETLKSRGWDIIQYSLNNRGEDVGKFINSKTRDHADFYGDDAWTAGRIVVYTKNNNLVGYINGWRELP
jgi:hypothetical protein